MVLGIFNYLNRRRYPGMSGMARFTKNVLSVNHYFIIYEGYWLET